MPTLQINGGKVAYEILGDGDPIVLTAGGRFSMGIAGLRPLAEALSPHMKVLIWDRPNAGASDLKFTGETESDMHADTLAELLRQLDLAPAVIAGGSAGARVALLTAVRHPDVARKVLGWWLSGGVYGTLILAMTYNLPFMATALTEGMKAVADMPQWAETIAANPDNRERLLGMDVEEFINVMPPRSLPHGRDVTPGAQLHFQGPSSSSRPGATTNGRGCKFFLPRATVTSSTRGPSWLPKFSNTRRTSERVEKRRRAPGRQC